MKIMKILENPIRVPLKVEALANYSERERKLTKNEKRVMKGLKGLADWLEGYRHNILDVRQEINRYVPAFEREFVDFESASSEEKMLREAAEADIVYFGDNHNLRREQQYVAQMVESLQAGGRSSVLGIEFIHSKDQRHLDDYLMGKISEEEFLKRIRFSAWANEEHWKGYRDLLWQARRNRVLVFGIEAGVTKGANEQEDLALAKNLKKIKQSHPVDRLFVQIGEAHLASRHLPQKVSACPEFRGEASVRILQNLPHIYLSALERFDGFKLPKVLKLKEGAYHIQTVPFLTSLLADIEYALSTWDEETTLTEFWADGFGLELLDKMREYFGLQEDKDRLLVFCLGEDIPALLQRLKSKLSPTMMGSLMSTLEEKGCAYFSDGVEDFLIMERFRLKKVLEEMFKFAWQSGGWPGEPNQSFQFFCSKLFIPEREPQTEAEKLGEVMFQNFLAGRPVIVSEFSAKAV